MAREARGRDGMQPLHGGRHSLPPSLVAHNQRERLLSATAMVVGEHGYNGLTVTLVTKTASVSRRTFYENFEDKEGCFAATYEAIDEGLAASVDAVLAAEGEWRAQIAGAISTLLGFVAKTPYSARLFLVESAVWGRDMLAERDRLAGRLVEVLAAGRAERRTAPELAVGIEYGLLGGVLALLGRFIRAGKASRAASLAPAIVEFVTTPYIGADQARSLAT